MSAVSRRGWLRGILPSAAGAAADAVERKLSRALRPRRRPPGAVAEPLFLELCDGCGACVEACPHAAVHQYTDAAGQRLAGTAVMRPENRACHMCEGFPCAAACDRGALEVPDAPLWRLGKAQISRQRCITFAGPECGACVGVCPGNLDAISLIRWRPELDSERCIGCGLCIEACPTIPSAIEMVPVDT